MFPHPYRILLDPQGGEGGTTTTNEGNGSGKVPDLAASFANLAEKLGTQQAAGEKLLSENKTYRDRLKELEDRAPRAGQVVVDAEAWSAYQALGKPGDVAKVVTEHGTLGNELAALRRDEELRTVADKAGVKFAVLRRLAGSAAFEVKSEKVNGKDTEVVRVKDGDAEAVPFDQHFADFLPALRPEGQATPQRPPGTPNRTTPRGVIAGPTDTARRPVDTGLRTPRV
jgi:hypothetical protein